jgi:hypothetical protein
VHVCAAQPSVPTLPSPPNTHRYIRTQTHTHNTHTHTQTQVLPVPPAVQARVLANTTNTAGMQRTPTTPITNINLSYTYVLMPTSMLSTPFWWFGSMSRCLHPCSVLLFGGLVLCRDAYIHTPFWWFNSMSRCLHPCSVLLFGGLVLCRDLCSSLSVAKLALNCILKKASQGLLNAPGLSNAQVC